jgi:uncharacterized protein (DUF1330 family)
LDWRKIVPKAYWIAVYKSISDPAALAEYGKLAGPALLAAGGTFIVRGVPAKTFEAGLNQRTVVIEFESVEKAVAAYESPAYRTAHNLIEGKVERDVRIVEGVA